MSNPTTIAQWRTDPALNRALNEWWNNPIRERVFATLFTAIKPRIDESRPVSIESLALNQAKAVGVHSVPDTINMLCKLAEPNDEPEELHPWLQGPLLSPDEIETKAQRRKPRQKP